MIALIHARLVMRFATFAGVGVGMLWFVASHAGSLVGEVVVFRQVEEADLIVGPVQRHVDRTTPSPLVLTLPEGEHRFQVKLRDEVLLDEQFRVESGGSFVLTAYDGRAKTPNSPEKADVPTKKARRE